MNGFVKIILLSTLLFVGLGKKSQAQDGENTSYKCMVQTINYKGEGAYIVVSLIDASGEYENTLYILGDDSEWFHTIDEWWKFFGKKKRSVDGITGPTVSGGERQVITFNVPSNKLDKGYKIRFETAVENQEYHPIDVEIPLTSEIKTSPYKGEGYIRYVRMMAN